MIQNTLALYSWRQEPGIRHGHNDKTITKSMIQNTLALYNYRQESVLQAACAILEAFILDTTDALPILVPTPLSR